VWLTLTLALMAYSKGRAAVHVDACVTSLKSVIVNCRCARIAPIKLEDILLLLPERLLDCHQQFVSVERLAQKINGAAGHGLLSNMFVAVGGDENHS
jgi:hypothetical protein